MRSAHGQAILARMIQARKVARLTQQQVAERMSEIWEHAITHQTVSKWEHGRGSPNQREFADLCALYGVSADWILKGIPSEPKTGSAVLDRLLGAQVPAHRADDQTDFENTDR